MAATNDNSKKYKDNRKAKQTNRTTTTKISFRSDVATSIIYISKRLFTSAYNKKEEILSFGRKIIWRKEKDS